MRGGPPFLPAFLRHGQKHRLNVELDLQSLFGLLCTTVHHTLLQDLTQDSATLTGWRRTKRSGEGKMIALYGLGISLLRYLNFPELFEIREFSGDLHDHQLGEFLSYAGILHSSIPEDIS